MEQPDRDRIDVFTFKDGVLCRVAHDLKLTIQNFTVETQGEAVLATFDCTSLKVEGAVKKGRIDHGELSPGNKQDIEQNIQRKVLKTTRYRHAKFNGQFRDNMLIGSLTLCGQTNEIRCGVAIRSGRCTAQVELKPSRWGIKPFKALMGAIRLQDRVLVTLDIGIQ